jgi:NADPH-dependent glutamate synthase beta subunit-like oxidoreductase
MGAPKGFSMGIPGKDDPRVLDGISTLKKINFNEETDITGDVAVVGGGNVAVDVARSSLRMSATSVTLLYRRTRAEMPAYEHEIEDAIDEGVEMKYLVNPISIKSKKEKIHVECVKMKLGEPDASGRRRPVPIQGSEFILKLDRLIMAIGQQSDVSDSFGVELNKRGRVITDEESLQTSEKGVYAGGDLVSGPASVIEAVQMGRIAASSIDKYLGGSGEIEQQLFDRDEVSPNLGREEEFAYQKRVEIQKKDVKDRFPGFCQVEMCMSKDEAVKEAERCLRCQLRLKIDQPPMPPLKKKEKK